jgi:ketosteroid isomerase-like protein
MAMTMRIAVLAAAVAIAVACARPGEAPPAMAGAAEGTAPSEEGGGNGAAAEVRAAIDAANAETGRLVAAGDGAAIGRQYAPEGEIMPAHGEAIRGPDAIGRGFQAAIDAGLRGLTLVAEGVEVHGDTALEYGRYTAAGAGGELLDRGKYLVVWRRGPDGWRRHRDIATTSLPRPEIPAPVPAAETSAGG